MKDEHIGYGCLLLIVLLVAWELVIFLVLFGSVFYIVSKIHVGIKYRRFVVFSLISFGFELSSLVFLCSLQVRVPEVLELCGLYSTISSYCEALNFDDGESYVKFASQEYEKYNINICNMIDASDDDTEHLYHDFCVGMSKLAFVKKQYSKKQYELCNDKFFECFGLFYKNKLGGIVLSHSEDNNNVYISEDKYYTSNKTNNTESYFEDEEDNYSYENEYSMERKRLNENTELRIDEINEEYAPISYESVLQDWQISKMFDAGSSYDYYRQKLKDYWKESTNTYYSIKKNLVQKYGHPSLVSKSHYRYISFWKLTNNKSIILDSFLKVTQNVYSEFYINNETRLFIYNTSITNDYIRDMKYSEDAKAKKKAQKIQRVLADRDSELKKIRQAEKKAEEENMQEQRREQNEKNKVQTDF